tara:strand:+ start:14498 stop:15118 length:621 start_codon:yes stop_codon:yes gene_type:complete
MDNELLKMVIDSSANLFIAGVGVIQVLLLYLTFRVGTNFLSDHMAKIKEERRIQLVIDVKKDLYLLKRLSIQFYRKPNDIRQSSRNGVEIIKVKAFVTQLIGNMETKGLEISQLESEIRAKLDLIGKQNLKEEFNVFAKKYFCFITKYYNFNTHLKGYSAGDNVNALLKQFDEIPDDFDSTKFPNLRIKNQAFFKLQEMLTTEFNK